jgi:hypothetical protein
MKTIELTQGQVAKVDDADYEWLSKYKWRAMWKPERQCYYAVRTEFTGRITIYMHDTINRPIDGLETDHCDGDTLNNQRHNLRSATRSQNMANTDMHKNNTSGYKGVSWNKHSMKWESFAVLHYRKHHIGYHNDPVEAARAYDKKARELFGEFAYQNFPETE